MVGYEGRYKSRWRITKRDDLPDTYNNLQEQGVKEGSSWLLCSCQSGQHFIIIHMFVIWIIILRRQSVGKSLTFRGTVFEANHLIKSHKCADPVCDTQLLKVGCYLVDVQRFQNEWGNMMMWEKKGMVLTGPWLGISCGLCRRRLNWLLTNDQAGNPW